MDRRPRSTEECPAHAVTTTPIEGPSLIGYQNAGAQYGSNVPDRTGNVRTVLVTASLLLLLLYRVVAPRPLEDDGQDA